MTVEEYQKLSPTERALLDSEPGFKQEKREMRHEGRTSLYEKNMNDYIFTLCPECLNYIYMDNISRCDVCKMEFIEAHQKLYNREGEEQ